MQIVSGNWEILWMLVRMWNSVWIPFVVFLVISTLSAGQLILSLIVLHQCSSFFYSESTWSQKTQWIFLPFIGCIKFAVFPTISHTFGLNISNLHTVHICSKVILCIIFLVFPHNRRMESSECPSQCKCSSEHFFNGFPTFSDCYRW